MNCMLFIFKWLSLAPMIFIFNYNLGHQEAGHGRGHFCGVVFISRAFCSRCLFPLELPVWPERLEEMDCIISCTVQWWEWCLQTRWENIHHPVMRHSFTSENKEVPFKVRILSVSNDYNFNCCSHPEISGVDHLKLWGHNIFILSNSSNIHRDYIKHIGLYILFCVFPVTPPRLKGSLISLSAADLSKALSQFVREVRRPNGERYAPDSILYLCLSIQKVC